MNSKYPLVYLKYYLAKVDFQAADGSADGSLVKKGTLLQYKRNISNIHGMMELVQFTEVSTGRELTWEVRTEELYDNWAHYLAQMEAQP